MKIEKRMIDRDALMAQLEDRQAFLVKEWGYRDHYTRGFEEAVDKVGNAPAVDAVEVVRCKDCKHYKNNGHNFYCDCDSVNECTDSCFFAPPDEDFYCRYGERKDIVWKIADQNWERITNFNGIPLDGEERKDND